MMGSIAIHTKQGATRRFTYTPIDEERRGYVLTGKRNAMYAAVRFVDSPEHLHLITWSGTAPFPGVVLTDTDGVLRQIEEA